METRRPRGTGTVYNRRDRGWRVKWRHRYRSIERAVKSEHMGYRIAARVEDLIEKGAELIDAVREALGEPDPCTGKLTNAQLADRYVDYLTRSGKHTTSSLAGDRSRAKYIKEEPIGDLYPDETDRATAARWAEALLVVAKKSGKTVNRALSFASKAWQYGQDHGHAPEGRNPFREVERHPEPRIDKDPLTLAEVDALIGKAAPDLRPLLIAGKNTGARAGELMALEWTAVNLEDRHLTIRASTEKAKRGRQVPLTDELHATLKALWGAGKLPAARVFVRANGKPWSHKTKDKGIREALARCKDKDVPAHKRKSFTFKGLRDTTVTVLLEQGVPWPVVGRIVGHGSPSTTMRYMGAMQDAQRAALKRLKTPKGVKSGKSAN